MLETEFLENDFNIKNAFIIKINAVLIVGNKH